MALMKKSTEKVLSAKINSLNRDSWDEVVAAFESDLYRRGQSEATINGYGACLNVFSRFYQDYLKKPGPYVEKLQKTDCRTYINYLRQDRQLAVTTINRHITVLRSFSKFIFAKGLSPHFLADGLKTYRPKAQKEIPSLSKKEVRRLVAAVDLNGRNGYRNLAILQLLLQCGLKVGELVRLSRDEVTLHKTTGKIRIRNEKGVLEREIPLNLTIRKALWGYLNIRGPIASHDPLFVSERQRRMSIAAVQHMIKRMLCIIGREDLSTYDLRHYFAMEFYSRSGELKATQYVLGHSDINTTARYAKVTANEIQETIDAMDS